MNTYLLRTALVALFVASAVTIPAAPAMLGHQGLAGQALDSEAVKAVLLGKKVAVGESRVVIVLAKSGEAQEAFLKARIGMTTSQFQNHWRRLFMTGGGTAPKIVESEADAIKLAGETPGGVVIADTAAGGALVVLAN
jgi:hypothetical protein